MNLLISSYDNSIKVFKPTTKKSSEFFTEMHFDFSLSSPAGQLHALNEFFKSDESRFSKDDNSVDLLIDDSQIGFGTFNLPKLSVFKVNDVFNTRFMINFPNYKDYYMHHNELLKNENGSVFFYSICKKQYIEDIKSFLKSQSLAVRNINFFSDHYVSIFNNKTEFPLATLIVGQNNSSLFISKNDRLLSVNFFDYGEAVLLGGNEYFHSPYFQGNYISKKYSCFIKDNFATKEIVTDEAVNKCDPNSVMPINMPKETRILKGNSLMNYFIKNNIKKYCSMIIDVAKYYAISPWFLPIGEINVICSDDFYNHLNNIEEIKTDIKFNKVDVDIKTIMSKEITNNKLFKSVVKGERRKIDWKKFFTLELGKKAKKH